MYVLLLSIFMAGRIKSVCVKHSQIQTREVILVNVFAGNSLRHHLGGFCSTVGNFTPPFVQCQVLCFTIPFEMFFLTDKYLEFIDVNF